MSIVVQETFEKYFDELNCEAKFADDQIPTYHTDRNDEPDKEETTGPYIKTFVIEQDYNEVADTIKTRSTTTGQVFEESGQIGFQIFIDIGFGDKDLYLGKQIRDAIKRYFVRLDLDTDDNNFVNFQDALIRQPIEIPRLNKSKGYGQINDWRRLDMFINYFHKGTY